MDQGIGVRCADLDGEFMVPHHQHCGVERIVAPAMACIIMLPARPIRLWSRSRRLMLGPLAGADVLPCAEGSAQSAYRPET